MYEEESSFLDNDGELTTEEEEVRFSVVIDRILDEGDFSRGDSNNAMDTRGGDVDDVFMTLQDVVFTLKEETGFTDVDQLMDTGGFSRGDVVNTVLDSRR